MQQHFIIRPRLLTLSFGLFALFFSFSGQGSPLIIDHAAVSAFTNLTDADIARVKKLWISYAGASHSRGIPVGCRVLSNVEPRCAVSTVTNGVPDGATTNHLRANNVFWGDINFWEWSYYHSERDWYASALAVARTKEGLRYCNTNILGGLDVFAFGWSWQPEWHNPPGGGTNTTHWTRWAGSSQGGPDGDLRWGLTAADYALTGNHVCMDTYLQAVEEYRRFCVSNSYPTRVIFSTAPPDGSGEEGYQTWVKNEYIRSYVSNTTDGILFDYADILCWDYNGRYTRTWTDWSNTLRTFPNLAPDNTLDMDGAPGRDDLDHIGERGALRLAKALWVMLAQMTVSDGTPSAPVLEVSNDTPGVVQVQFTAASNVLHSLQFTTDLASDNWQTIARIPSRPYERTILFLDHPSTGSTNRFYRIALQTAP